MSPDDESNRRSVPGRIDHNFSSFRLARGGSSGGGVHDVEVDAAAIQQQISSNLSVCVTHGRGAVVGQLGKLRPIGNRPTVAFAADSGGSQPPRRLPACPTSRQGFHLYVVHPRGSGRRVRHFALSSRYPP
jgi:hypothetical protein